MKQPYIIGIAGPSGGGKSTVAAAIAEKLDCQVFHTDAYFKKDLPAIQSPDDGAIYPDWNHPDSVRYDDLLEDLRAAAAGEHPYILVEGALLFAIPELRALFDYKLFVTARIETCLYRRILRNVTLFGQTAEFIGSYYLKCARHREAEYCLPSARYADAVIDNDVSFETQLDSLPFLRGDAALKGETTVTDYKMLRESLNALTAGVPHVTANLANAAALLYGGLSRLNWAGFYLLEGETLVLGPFQGRPACIEIPLGRGVCGTAAASGETVVVPDVHAFPGHIACDEASRSEIVVPLFARGVLKGVLDIDSPETDRFSEADRIGLEEFARTLEKNLWP